MKVVMLEDLAAHFKIKTQVSLIFCMHIDWYIGVNNNSVAGIFNWIYL